jgi:DNA repair protein SbcC/Rad50
MKAIKLKLKNIGPFRDETVDFTELGDMFLVSGKTGSGKTTIFDAMTYALYGDLCGARRKAPGEFRSDFSGPEDESFVEFTFVINGRTWRVSRTLPLLYINRNGRESVRPAEAVLECFDSTESVFVPFNGKINETNAKIAGIIGLSCAEFTQIVLLPQGAFADFLSAGSKDRSITLSKLFPIESYSRIITVAREKGSEFSEQRRTIEAQIMAMASLDSQAAEKRLDDLKGDIKKLTDEKSTCSEALETLSVNLERTQVALNSALDRERLAEEKRQLELQKDGMTELQKRIAAASQARILNGYIRNTEAAESRVRNLEDSRKNAEKDLDSAEKEAADLESRSGQMADLQKSAVETEVRLKYLEEQCSGIRHLQQVHVLVSKAQTEKKRAESFLFDARSSYAALLLKIQSLVPGENSDNDETDILQSLLEQKQRCETDFVKAKNDAATVVAARKLAADIAAAEAAMAKIAEQKDAADRLIENTRYCLDDFRVQQKLQEQNNYACVLAVQLEEGKPCPVCGATEHPHPVLPLPETINVAEKIETQEKNLELAVQHKTDLENQFTAIQAACGQQKQHLSEFDVVCSCTVEQAQRAVLDAQDLLEKNEKLYQKAKLFISELKSRKTDMEKIADAYQEAGRKVTAAETELKTLESTGIADQTEDAVLEQIRVLTAEKTEAERQYNSYAERLKNARGRRSALQANLEALMANHRQALHECSEAEAELAQKLASSCFTDRDGAKKAFVIPEKLSEMETEFTEWSDALKRTDIKLESLKGSGDSAGLSLAVEQIKKDMELKRKDISSIDDRIQKAVVEHANLASEVSRKGELEKQRQDLEDKCAHYLKLADDLSGQNPRKIPFDAWILGIKFAEVVHYANPRFERISGGRYHFKIAPEASGGNGYRGLDLLVSDSYTGRDRNTATLSGGETFMASISLALALTDVVQNESGGIRLDSLFIDEGFGTLDGEALDKAVSILQDIRESRTVGVISHVESMRTVIHSCLEVDKGVNGSRIRIHD